MEHFKGQSTLSVRVHAVMSLAMSLSLNCLDFLINHASHSTNGLEPELIRHDASIDIDSPN